jgi:hypothetical protein
MKRSILKRKAPIHSKIPTKTSAPKNNLAKTTTSANYMKMAIAEKKLSFLPMPFNVEEQKPTFIRFKNGLKPTKRIAPRSRTNKKRPRNFPYMLWIKTLPCAVCGWTGSEAAHTGPRGLGQKSLDEQCIPLCPDHHRHNRDALDVAGPRRFEELHSIDIETLVKRLQQVWQLLLDNPPITALNPAIDETNRVGYV